MITDTSIRLATPADAADIAELSKSSIEQGLPWRWRPERIMCAIDDVDTNVVVVRNDGLLVAFGIMSYRDDDAHLALFAVHRSSQRSGVGSAVLQWLEAVARAAGVLRIRLEVRRDNRAARSFYNEHGFQECAVRKGMYAPGVDGVRLEKYLRSR